MKEVVVCMPTLVHPPFAPLQFLQIFIPLASRGRPDAERMEDARGRKEEEAAAAAAKPSTCSESSRVTVRPREGFVALGYELIT